MVSTVRARYGVPNKDNSFYITLDEYGQNAVDAIIRSEFARCQEQGGLKSTKGISVAVKIRNVK